MADERPVVIVGAGLSGLCCARRLNAAGRRCVVLEAGDDVGGRVRTDRHDGFLLDRGFQVYNDAYPESRDVLDHAALSLRRFEPGALTRVNGRFRPIVDPFRRPTRAIGTALSPAATLADKVKVATLRATVTRGEADDLLQGDDDQTTLEFLREYGFSDKIIESFFRPFFGGVYLDRSLGTSAKLFRWLFRMFADGSACVPAGGMGQIPRQIYRRLRMTEVRLNARVEAVEPGAARLADGTRVGGPAVVVATEAPVAARLLGDHAPADLEVHQPRRTATLFFAASRPAVADNLLLLSGTEYADCRPVNTVAQMSLAAPSYAPPGQTLLSVSLVDVPDGDDDALLDATRTGLSNMLGDSYAKSLRHLRTYRVDYALPDQSPPGLADPHKPAAVGDGLFVCGDARDTASINGSMLSGRRAAEAVLAGA